MRQLAACRQTPGNLLQLNIGTWLQPRHIVPEAAATQYRHDLRDIAAEAISWTTPEEWVLVLPIQLPSPPGG